MIWTRADTGTDGNQLSFIIAFDALCFLAVISLSIVFLTAWFSTRIRRVSTWYLYIFSWDIFSVARLLIVGHQTGSLPGRGICLIQSVMLHATAVFTAVATVIFVAQIYLDIRYVLGSQISPQALINKLMILPWIFSLATIILFLIIGLIKPEAVEREPTGLFCHLISVPCRRTSASIVVLCIIITVVLGAMTATGIHRNRIHWDALLGSRERRSYDLAFRLSVFLLAPLIAIGLAVIAFFPKKPYTSNSVNAGVSLLYGIMPATIGLVSACQKDILDVWMFWRSPGNGSELDVGEQERGREAFPLDERRIERNVAV